MNKKKQWAQTLYSHSKTISLIAILTVETTLKYQIHNILSTNIEFIKCKRETQRINMKYQIVTISIIVAFISQFPVGWSCRLLVPAELINGCIFDPMIISVPSTQFTINRDTCNTAVQKDIFNEQPIVYYGRAKEVGRIFPLHFLNEQYRN